MRPREMWSFAPLFLAAMGLVNAILGFRGDVWERSEMERHAFVGSMVLRLRLMLCLLRLIEEARRRWSPRAGVRVLTHEPAAPQTSDPVRRGQFLDVFARTDRGS